MNLNRPAYAAAAFIAAVLGLQAASAWAITYNQPFSGAYGTDPADFSDPASRFGMNGNGVYVTTNTLGTPPNVVYTAFDPVTADADYTVSATFSFLNGTSTTPTALNLTGVSATLPTFGVIGRYQNDSNFYEARTDGDTFDIVRRGGSGTAVIASASNNLATAVVYTITFTVHSNQLSATLTGDNGTNLTLSPIIDNNFTDGGAGLRGRIGVTSQVPGITALSIDSFRINSIPEPATLTLLALGGLAMIQRRRSR